MMRSSDPRAFPALFRAGDIGVASEWRDLSYDWSPVLTGDGVFIYSYLRDTYDHQRNLRPFLLSPEGPTKKIDPGHNTYASYAALSELLGG